MANGFSFFIVPNEDIISREGPCLRKGVAYGFVGASAETQIVSSDGYTRLKSELSIRRSKTAYRSLTRDEAKAEGLKLPLKRTK